MRKRKVPRRRAAKTITSFVPMSVASLDGWADNLEMAHTYVHTPTVTELQVAHLARQIAFLQRRIEELEKGEGR